MIKNTQWKLIVNIERLKPHLTRYNLRYKFFASGLCSYSTFELFGKYEEPFYNVLIFVPFVASAGILIFCPVHMALMLSNRSNERQASQTLVVLRAQDPGYTHYARA